MKKICKKLIMLLHVANLNTFGSHTFFSKFNCMMTSISRLLLCCETILCLHVAIVK